MLTKLNPETVQSAHNLVQMPAWKVLETAARNELAKTYEAMRDTHNIVALHQLQGRAQLLSEILELAGTTSSLLGKLRS
jgi:hypothetical protein